MTRINIAIPIFAFIKSGGMRVITNMANEWVKIGHFVEFIVTNETQPYFPTKAQITRIRAESKRDKLFELIKYLNENYEKYDAIIVS